MTTQVSPLVERYRTLAGFWRWIIIAFSILGIVLAVTYIFNLRLFGIMIFEHSYFYLLLASYFSVAFLLFPVKKGVSARRFFWFDVFLFLLSVGICIFFAWQGYEIIYRGWGYLAPLHITIMAVILWPLILEALRRTSGLTLAIIILVFSLYPLYAAYMPAFLEGQGRPFTTTAVFHILSVDSVLGIPLRVFGGLLVGFMIFGVALQATGGGRFFLNLAFSLLGSTRGGPAKVAVMASALFGSMSGSVISNVVTTGSITIPSMKRSGYPPAYAGAIECCASTGGVLMPPVMGATAFVMAAFLGISYAYIAVAAAIPSILYYLGLLMQVDAYAAKTGMAGISKSEVPPLKQTLKEGWIYLLALVVLMYFLFSLRLVGQAPFFGTAALLVLSMFRKETRFTLNSFIQFIESTGKFLAELITILAAVGMILGALAVTGVGASIARELVVLAGGNVAFMLILGALASFILGMGMTITACYVFLAIVLAPALVMVGLNELAVHLFVMYCGMLSFITPPVALAAFPAATIAQSSPLKVALTATRLGGVIYLLPFFFILTPALILQGGVGEIVYAIFTCVLAVMLISGGLQGYILGIGRIGKGGIRSFLLMIALVGSGILLGLPGLWGLSGWQTDVLGLVVAFVALFPTLLLKIKS